MKLSKHSPKLVSIRKSNIVHSKLKTNRRNSILNSSEIDPKESYKNLPKLIVTKSDEIFSHQSILPK